jgi:hypothetical protein
MSSIPKPLVRVAHRQCRRSWCPVLPPFELLRRTVACSSGAGSVEVVQVPGA